jgi:hypothetical protein
VFQSVARAGTAIEVLLARRGIVQRKLVVPGKGPGAIALDVDETAPESARQLRDIWLASKPRQPGAPANTNATASSS